MRPAQVRSPSLKVTQLDAQWSQDLGIFQLFPLLISNSLPLWPESILCRSLILLNLLRLVPWLCNMVCLGKCSLCLPGDEFQCWWVKCSRNVIEREWFEVVHGVCLLTDLSMRLSYQPQGGKWWRLPVCSAVVRWLFCSVGLLSLFLSRSSTPPLSFSLVEVKHRYLEKYFAT